MFQETFQLQPDEKIIIFIRRHWIFLVLDFVQAFFLFLLPAFLLWTIQILGLVPSFVIFGITFNALLNILLWMWGIICWLLVAEKFTDYALDFWIVTDKRIVESELVRLFSRKLSTLELQDIEDITISNPGFFSNYFSYGNLEVQTAGARNEFQADKIANPEFVQRVMFDAKLKDEQEKRDIEKGEMEQISHRIFREEQPEVAHDFHIPSDQKRENLPKKEVVEEKNESDATTEDFDWAHVAQKEEEKILSDEEEIEEIEDKYKSDIDSALRTE